MQEIIVGKDGKVRGAVVKTTGKSGRVSFLQRPIQLLYPFEIHPTSKDDLKQTHHNVEITPQDHYQDVHVANPDAPKAAEDHILELMTDTSKNIGTHKLRFDESGDGKALEGRDSVQIRHRQIPNLVSTQPSYVTGNQRPKRAAAVLARDQLLAQTLSND